MVTLERILEGRGHGDTQRHVYGGETGSGGDTRTPGRAGRRDRGPGARRDGPAARRRGGPRREARANEQRFDLVASAPGGIDAADLARTPSVRRTGRDGERRRRIAARQPSPNPLDALRGAEADDARCHGRRLRAWTASDHVHVSSAVARGRSPGRRKHRYGALPSCREAERAPTSPGRDARPARAVSARRRSMTSRALVGAVLNDRRRPTSSAPASDPASDRSVSWSVEARPRADAGHLNERRQRRRRAADSGSRGTQRTREPREVGEADSITPHLGPREPGRRERTRP